MKIEITEVTEVGYLPRLELRADGKFITSFSYTDEQRRAERLAEAMRIADDIVKKGNALPISTLVYKYDGDKIVYQEGGEYDIPKEVFGFPCEDFTGNEQEKEKEITIVINDRARLELFLKSAKTYLDCEPKHRELSLELDGIENGYLVFLPTDFSESLLCQHVFSIGTMVGMETAQKSYRQLTEAISSPDKVEE